MLLHHAVRSFVGSWLSLFLTTFPINVSCRWAICFRIVGVDKNLLRMVPFVILLSITCVMSILSIFLMLRCKNTSNLLSVFSLNAQRQLTFIGKVVRNKDNQLPKKLLTEWCNNKRKRGAPPPKQQEEPSAKHTTAHTRRSKRRTTHIMGILCAR